MSSSPVPSPPPPPPHCAPVDDFLLRLSSTFQTCVPTYLALLSTLLGSLSILAWLFAQLPQIHRNYAARSTAGLSIYFLAEWCLGDGTNLLGAVLTGQASWQVVVASYYTIVDCVLVAQFVWYTHYVPRRKGTRQQRARPVRRPARRAPDPSSLSSRWEDVFAASSSSRAVPSSAEPAGAVPWEKASPGPSGRTVHGVRYTGFSPAPSPKTLLVVAMLCAVLANASPVVPRAAASGRAHDDVGGGRLRAELAGRLLSWASTLLYLGSRLPQIYKNHARRSTAGLSPALFVAAFFGNLFYSGSLLTNPLAWRSYPPHGARGWAGPEGSDRATWLGLAAPFWLGAAGVLALDAVMGLQFLAYGAPPAEGPAVGAKHGRGKSQWRRMSGWMRGWIPSPNPAEDGAQATVDGGHDERPLLSRDSYDEGTEYGSM